MPSEVTRRLEELKRDLERQDEQWAEVEKQFNTLSSLGIAVKRDVLDDFDDALVASSRTSLFLHHQVC